MGTSCDLAHQELGCPSPIRKFGCSSVPWPLLFALPALSDVWLILGGALALPAGCGMSAAPTSASTVAPGPHPECLSAAAASADLWRLTDESPHTPQPKYIFQKQNQCSKLLIPWGMEQEPLGDVKTCATQLFSSSISLLLSQVCLQSTGPGAWCSAGTAERQALAFPITARTGKGQGTDVAPEKLSGTCTFTPCCNVQHRFSPYVQALDLARASVILHFRESLLCLKAPHTRHQLNNFMERSKKTVLFVCFFLQVQPLRAQPSPWQAGGYRPG